MFSGIKNGISEMAKKSKESLSKMISSNTGASAGEGGEVDKKTKEEKDKLAKIFYQAAGEKFIHELCESLYASENEKSGQDMKSVLKENNFKGRFVNIVIDNVTKSLDDPRTIQKIRDIVFGTEDNPGLRKYIQDIFKISTCEYKDNHDEIYPFTERVLQKLFKPDDPTIPDILIKTLTDPNVMSGVGSIEPSVVLTKMVEIIHLELNKSTVNVPSPQTGGANGSITNPDTQESNQPIPVSEAIPVEDSKESYVGFTKGQPNLDEKTTRVVNEIKEGLNNNDLDVANQSQKRIIDIIESEYPETQSFSSVIQQNILTAIQKIMERFKDVLYEEIKTKVIDNYVNKFLDENTIKLQILYSILSYDPKTQSEKCCDNSFAVSREIFEKSIGKILVQFKGINNEETISKICLDKDTGIMHYLHQTLLERQTSGDKSLKAIGSSIIGGRKLERKNIKIKKSKKRRSKKTRYNKSSKMEQSKKSTKKYSRLLSKRKRSHRK